MELIEALAPLLILVSISAAVVCFRFFRMARGIIAKEAEEGSVLKDHATEAATPVNYYVKRRAFKYVAGRKTNYFAQKRFIESE